jgi:hypothetical protein
MVKLTRQADGSYSDPDKLTRIWRAHYPSGGSVWLIAERSDGFAVYSADTLVEAAMAAACVCAAA